jgi:hypothetical protein
MQDQGKGVGSQVTWKLGNCRTGQQRRSRNYNSKTRQERGNEILEVTSKHWLLHSIQRIRKENCERYTPCAA